MPRPAAPDPASFPFWTEEKLRVADTDLNGHINNGAFGAFCEAGRAELWEAVAGPLAGRPVTMALARVEIDYLRELHYPGRVQVGSAVARIGTSSFTVRQGLFRDGTCFATGQSVMVVLDPATRRPAAIPAALRDGLARFSPPA